VGPTLLSGGAGMIDRRRGQECPRHRMQPGKEGSMKWKCVFLRGRHLKTCGAVKGIVALSSLELQLLCEGGAFEDCPVFQTYMQKRGVRIREEEYDRMFNEWCCARGGSGELSDKGA